MRRIGVVDRAAGGVAVVRCEGDPPEIGDRLVDDRLTNLGRVVDVFGPVGRPYLAVSTEDPPAEWLGTACYVR